MKKAVDLYKTLTLLQEKEQPEQSIAPQKEDHSTHFTMEDLQTAILNENAELAAEIIDENPDYLKQTIRLDEDELTPLMLASSIGSDSIIISLVYAAEDAGMSKAEFVNTRNASGHTALDYAVKNRHDSATSWLIAAGGARVTKQQLDEALRNEKRSMSELLVKTAFEQFGDSFAETLNAPNESAENTLCLAVKHKEPAIVKFLLEHSVTADPPVQNQKTPLSIALLNEDYYMAKLLLEHGADAERELGKDSYPAYPKCRPLDYAFVNGRLDLANLLMNYGATLPFMREGDNERHHVVSEMLSNSKLPETVKYLMLNKLTGSAGLKSEELQPMRTAQGELLHFESTANNAKAIVYDAGSKTIYTVNNLEPHATADLRLGDHVKITRPKTLGVHSQISKSEAHNLGRC